MLQVLFSSLLIVFLLFGQAVIIGLGVVSAAIILTSIIMHGKQDFSGIRKTILSPPVVSLFLFLIYCMASSLWSVAPTRSFESSRNLMITSAVFVVAFHLSARLRLATRPFVTVAVMCCISAFVMVEMLFNYPVAWHTRAIFNLGPHLFQPMDKGIALVAIFLPVFLVSLKQNRKLLTACYLIILAAIVIQPMRAALVAGILGPVCYYLCIRFGRRFTNLFFVVIAAGLMFLPLLVNELTPQRQIVEVVSKLPLSWQYRVQMWEKASSIIALKPLQGWGADSTRNIEKNLDDGSEHVFQNHPHDMILQIWIELGMFGVLLALGIVAALWKALAKLENESQALWVATAAAYLVFASVSFSMWPEWWWGCLLLAGLYIRLSQPGKLILPEHP